MKIRKLYVEAYQRYKERPNWSFQARVRVRLEHIKTGEIKETWAYSKGFKRYNRKAMFKNALKNIAPSLELKKIYTAKYDVIKEVVG